MKAIELKDVPLFGGLDGEDFEQLQTCLKEKTFNKGEVVFAEGKMCERIFIVRSGRIKLYRMASNGREQILETLGPGDTCACNPGNLEWSCSSTGEAAVPSSVWFLSRYDYVKLVQDNTNFSMALNEIFANRLRCFTNLIEEVSLKDVKKRLAKFLLDMLEQKGDFKKKNSAVFIPFTREEIAQRLGATRETVTRYLSQFKEEGLIEVKPYQIVIQDKVGLQKILT